jgi:hypothetical protein
MPGALKAQTSPGVWTTVGYGSTADQAALWNAGRGQVYTFPKTVTDITITTESNITQTLSVTFQNGRRYRVTAYIRAISPSTTGGAVTMKLYDGAIDLVTVYGGASHSWVAASTNYGTMNAQWIIDGTGQVHPNLRITMQGPTGALAHCTSGNSACYIEDIGPVTRLPAGSLPPDSDWTEYDARYLTPAQGDGRYHKRFPDLISGLTAATYTFTLGDIGNFVYFYSATAQTAYVPANTTLPYPVGTQIHCIQGNTGRLTIAPAPASGVLIGCSTATLGFRAQHSVATLFKLNTDYWVLSGDTL